MNKINYEQEVKRAFPTAVIMFCLDDDGVKYLLRETIVEIPADETKECDMWQSAYEQLKKEGKL